MASSSDAMAISEAEKPAEEEDLPEQILRAPSAEIFQRSKMLESEITVLKSDVNRLTREKNTMWERIRENADKIKVNKTLPYLVGNIVEILEVGDEEEVSQIPGKAGFDADASIRR
mmetsp:Transcript_31135/g.119815  ORF Transcript_31135/g.119815 Transcript_31135/m.119815 type:complete len:116 (-) Transcript_31135:2977-3324(-)